MRTLPNLRREELEELVAGLEVYLRREEGGDVQKRQGLIGGLLGGGASLIGNLLGGNNGQTTTTQRRTTTTDRPPPPTTTQPPPVTQAPPPTTQAPPVQNPPTTAAPPQTSVVNPPATTVIQPPSSAPTTAIANPNPNPTTILISTPTSIAIPTRTALPHLDPGLTQSTHPFPTTGLVPPTSIPGVNPSSPFSSLTSIDINVPTTFQTSTLTTPTTTSPTDDSMTANPIMDGGSASGRGNISSTTIIISVVVIIFGSLAILALAFFISRNYIKKKKITVGFSFDPSIQTSENPFSDPAPPLFSNPVRDNSQNPFSSPEDAFADSQRAPVRRSPPYPPPSGPLPPVPKMRAKGKLRVERLVGMFPKPPSLSSLGSLGERRWGRDSP